MIFCDFFHIYNNNYQYNYYLKKNIKKLQKDTNFHHIT